MNIYIDFLGDPSVRVNNELIDFPYKKAAALFYYMVLNQKASRETLIALFWAEFDDTSAKKNLRDAIYKVKKTFGFDVLISPNKSDVYLNQTFCYDSDVHQFLKKPSLLLYKGPFLNNFFIKDCYEFDEWINSKRHEFHQTYLNLVQINLHKAFQDSSIIQIEKYADIIIKEDPYNEKILREIMKQFSLKGEYNKALGTYYQLVNILKKDLDIEPETSTTSLFKEIIEMRSSDQPMTLSNTSCIGRKHELNQLKNGLEHLLRSQGKSYFISGEAGIGKSYLLKTFIDSIDTTRCYILKSHCHETDKSFFLQPWDHIFKQVRSILDKEKIQIPKLWRDVISYFFPSFNESLVPLDIDTIERIESVKFQISFDAIMGVFKLISSKKPVMVVFDDIHWMDAYSFNLVGHMLYRLDHMMIIATYRDSFHKEMDEKIFNKIPKDALEFIQVDRFDLNETADLIHQFSPDLKLSESMIRQIHQDTEGIVLFILEYLHLLKDKNANLLSSVKVDSILKGKYYALKTIEQKILDIASVFFDNIELNFILTYFKIEESQIFEALDTLQNKKLLVESHDEDTIYYNFNHSIMRDFVLGRLSHSIKIHYHNQIGYYYETKLKNNTKDRFIYPRIIKHYEAGHNDSKILDYSIKNLSTYSNINLEQFPHLHKSDMIDPIDFEVLFKQIDALMEKVSIDTLQKKHYEMSYLYIKGKYYIKTGEYRLGLPSIQLFLQYAEDSNSYNHLVDGYHQMIYYAIQVNDLNKMLMYIKKLEKLTDQQSDIKEKGNLCRWQGLYHIRKQEYDQGIVYLNRSIEIFENLSLIENRYILNIAAAYNYLGNIWKYQQNYDHALTYYKKAINLCEVNNIMKGLDLFYTGLAQSYYELGKITLCKEALDKAFEFFDKFNNTWGRDIAEAYAAKIALDHKDYESYHYHLAKGEYYANQLKNPYSLTLIDSVKTIYSNQL